MKKLILILFFICGVCEADELTNKTFKLLNAQRKSHGLNVLTWNDKLEQAAKSQSDWMSQVGVMTHVRGKQPPSSLYELKNSLYHPVDRIIKTGYYPIEKIYSIRPDGYTANPNADNFWGEIIAHGKPGSGSNRNYPYRTDILVKGWMNSPGHKAQILKIGLEEMAVAYTSSPNGDVFWCVIFGKK